jgi:hypothetical protein
VQVIENSIDIARDAQTVFDFCSDVRTEAGWNPAVRSAALLTPGPIGPGSRFALRARGTGESVVEVVEFTRPSSWTHAAVGGPLPMRAVGAVVPRGADACRLTVRLEIRATGPLRLLEPAIARLMRPTARGNIRRIREQLERTGGT